MEDEAESDQIPCTKEPSGVKATAETTQLFLKSGENPKAKAIKDFLDDKLDRAMDWGSPNLALFKHVLQPTAVADLGFPRGGGANPKGGAPTYYLANFSRKLHENEEILGQRGARVPHAPLRSATEPI